MKIISWWNVSIADQWEYGFSQERQAQISRMKKKSDILDWVRKKLNKGHKPSEILDCLAFASDQSIKMECEENYAESSEAVEFGFSLNQNTIHRSYSEDDLLEVHLKDRWIIEWKIRLMNPIFLSSNANWAIAHAKNPRNLIDIEFNGLEEKEIISSN